jgi:hypothetical protein
METMLSKYPNLWDAPRRPYIPQAVTMAEFVAMSNEIDAARQQNTELLQNPQLAVDSEEFHTKAEEAQIWARQLNHMETMGMPPAQNDLAHGQEVVIYATSRLRAAVSAWIHAVENDEEYDECRIWWMDRLMFEVVSGLAGNLSSSVADTCCSAKYSRLSESLRLQGPVRRPFTR